MAYFSTKLGQIFNVYGAFTPTKASAYLKPVNCGLDTGYFSLDSATGVVIDSLNFLNIDQGDMQLMGLDDNTSFDGDGFLTSISAFDTPTAYPVAHYPIKVSSSFLGSFRLWLRARSTSGTVGLSVLLGGAIVGSVSSAVADSSWAWYSLDFNINSSNLADLGIRFNETGVSLDKLYLCPTATSIGQVGDDIGEPITDSPFITISANVYPVDENNNVLAPLAIYDYKTTAEGVVTDDWYNFDINFLDVNYAVDFDGRYALVLYTSGSTASRFILWELAENDEYICGPSIFKYNE